VIPESIQTAIAKLLAVESWLASGGAKGTLLPPARDYAVDVAAIKKAEDGLDGRFSDEALAIFAAELTILGERYGMVPQRAVEHTKAARAQGVPTSLISIGCEAGRIRTFVCLPATPVLGERPRLTIAGNNGGSMRREPLEGWLLERIDEALDDLELSPNQQRRLNEDDVLEAFVPHLRGGVVAVAGSGADGAPAEAGLRRVEHPKFGGGTVVRELLGGPEPKLEIVFDTGGRRVLLARFVAAS